MASLQSDFLALFYITPLCRLVTYNIFCTCFATFFFAWDKAITVKKGLHVAINVEKFLGLILILLALLGLLNIL